MQVEKNILKSDLCYNDDKTKRYLLKIEWDKTKKKACIIMLSAGRANGLFFDRTTSNVVENLVEADYGSVDVLNLFSCLCEKTEDVPDAENLRMIEQSAKNADVVIFAAGTGHSADKKVQKRQKDVLTKIKKYDKKLFCIADSNGQKFYHPLCPKVKKWNLVKFDVEELTRKGYDYD